MWLGKKLTVSCHSCLECLVSFFTLLIREGLVRQVHCPSPECVAARNKRPTRDKPDAEPDMNIGIVTEDELMQIVGPELTKRYKDLSLKQRLESGNPCSATSPASATDEVAQTRAWLTVLARPAKRQCPRQRTTRSCVFAMPAASRSASSASERGMAPGTHARSLSRLRLSTNGCQAHQTSALSLSSDTESQTCDDSLRSWKRSERTRLGSRQTRPLAQAVRRPCRSRKGARTCSAQDATRISASEYVPCVFLSLGSGADVALALQCGSSLSPSDPYKHFSSPGSRCYNKLFEFTPGNEPHIEEWIGTVLVD